MIQQQHVDNTSHHITTFKTRSKLKLIISQYKIELNSLFSFSESSSTTCSNQTLEVLEVYQI